MPDSSEFKRVIICDPYYRTIHEWAKTLPPHEQQEWNRVHTFHESVVDRAVANGDAMRADNKIFWKSAEIHQEYFCWESDNDIYLDFWKRFKEQL
jgi:hypothetical protein